MMTTVSALAGDILTNTNQSVAFLKNPSRDAAIALDGVYSNPAGVAFMPEGFHVAFNWQYAHQTRTITSTNPVYSWGRKNSGDTKVFEGVADAPIIPSLQAAYNKGKWSIQFNFSVPGGGGKCEFADGLGSFERVVGSIAQMLQPLGAQGYDMDGYMRGRQYYYGVQLGAAYKITPDLSVYGGLRLLYGDATYKAKISNIQVLRAEGPQEFGAFLEDATTTIKNGLELVGAGIQQVNAGIAQYEAAGAPVPAELLQQQAQLLGTQAQLKKSEAGVASLLKYAQGVNLLCNQTSLGIAPVFGIDYKVGRFNFAAKYEFKTQIRMKNESTVNEASAIPAVNKFRDGEEVNEDQPAQLALGVQWSPIDQVRINAGWHHFFDKDASWYNNSQELLKHNTNEFSLGAEWDINDRLNVSAGGQVTRYGLSDEYMNDMSFVVNSFSIGLGFNFKVKKNITLSAAYFQTYYDNYDMVTPQQNMTAIGLTIPAGRDSFTRTNRVFGVGCQVDF